MTEKLRVVLKERLQRRYDGNWVKSNEELTAPNSVGAAVCQ
jgi:hypothetical protein